MARDAEADPESIKTGRRPALQNACWPLDLHSIAVCAAVRGLLMRRTLLQDCSAGAGGAGAGGGSHQRPHQHRGGSQASRGQGLALHRARRALGQLPQLLRLAALLHDLGLRAALLLQALACRQEVHLWEEGATPSSLPCTIIGF